jgi:hypothetical protein
LFFSQRHGYKPIKNVIQKDYIDDDLRNKLWNTLVMTFLEDIKIGYYTEYKHFIVSFWHNYLKAPIDTLPNAANDFRDRFRKHFYNCQWYEVYDLLEYFYKNWEYDYQKESFKAACNCDLEQELSAYRLIGGKITPITSDDEIAEIEKVLSDTYELKPVSIHLKTALEKLSDRKSPDYRNSIKESMSAVEAICQLITKDQKATLGKCIKLIDNSVNIHPALKKTFETLYGYTSDADGIRHALTDEPNLQFEDAKFILVVCSSFINYLISKASKADIEF